MDAIIMKSVLKGVELFVSSFFEPTVYNLEPLSAVIRVALLEYYEQGSKLNFSQHIEVVPPTIYQPLIRTYSGDSRGDIHLLERPILKVLKTYPIKEIEIILINFIRGLNCLKSNYKDTIAEGCINRYIDLVQQALTAKTENNGNYTDWDQEHIVIICKLFESMEHKKTENKDVQILVESAIKILRIYE